MATIKSYTDLEQSQVLSKILPLESADMYYWCANHYPKEDWIIEVGTPDDNYECICAWSLAALLGILPFHLIINNQRYAFSMHKGLNRDGETYMIRYNIFNTDICLYKTEHYNSPVDACVDIIEKLNELKML